MDAGSTLVFLADLFDQTAGHQILKLFIGTQAEHLFATADRITNLEVFENPFEKVVESEYLLFRKYRHQLIGDVIGEAA